MSRKKKGQNNTNQHKEPEQHIDGLDVLSDYLDRAIRGIFIFALQNLPQHLWQAFSFLIKLVWKGIKQIFHFLKEFFLRLFWILPKKIFEWFVSAADFLLRLISVRLKLLILVGIVFDPLIVTLNINQFIDVAILWCIFSVGASLWGLIHLRSGRWRIRQAISRVVTMLKFWRKNDS